jgi:hypothetical protein
MTRILPATKALWIFTGIVAVIAFGLIGKVLNGLTLGNRLFSLYSDRLIIRHFISGIFALLLIGGWIWAVLQDYLFLTAVFPVAACWLGYAVLLLSLAFLMQFLFPKCYID